METDIRFTHEPITVPPLALPSREIGSVLEFHGLVREMENGEALEGLFYEGHEPMAAFSALWGQGRWSSAAQGSRKYSPAKTSIWASKMTLLLTVKTFTFRFHHTENVAYIKKILVGTHGRPSSGKAGN